ncbi:MAG TPA: tetratricopeptide repeat protein [Methylomirabilota bacterium]|nr:tetratricopeptide repeat protein [Methylomirabilota bacterium]
MSRRTRPSPKPTLEARPAARRQRWRVMLVMVLAATLAGVAWWGARSPQPAPVPVIDLSGVEPARAGRVRSLLEAVRARPEAGEDWGRLGMALRALGYRSEAGQALVEAQRLDPGNARWPYFRALLLEMDDPEAAVLALREAIQRCGNDPPTPRLRLARWLVEQGRTAAARAELTELLEAHPDHPSALILLAQVAMNEGRVDEAERLAGRCETDPRTARRAAVLRAQIHQRAGRAAQAREMAYRARSLPNDAEPPDPWEAEAALALDDPRPLSDQVQRLLAAQRLEAAAPLIGRLVKEHPTFAESWLLLGRFELLSRDATAAEKSVRRHLELEPQSVQGWFQLGMALLAQERFEEALAAFRRASELKPDHGPAHFNQGLALLRLGRPAEAVTPLRDAIRCNPEHAETYFLLADLHLRLGDREAARRCLRAIEALKPGDPRLVDLRSRLTNSG